MTPLAALVPSSDDVIAAVWRRLDTVGDPCHVLSGHDLSIVDLGLVNRVSLNDGVVEIGVTFTDPSCVFAGHIVVAVEDLAEQMPGVRAVTVVGEPYPLWTEARLSAKARALFADKSRRFGFLPRPHAQHPASAGAAP
ncbi:MAG: iron-sulfur cluster assembly protein [Rhodospirillaceae bacterium]|nr:iron-sulfur cluster assembly protein [Rhodospirillaceae bacterium]